METKVKSTRDVILEQLLENTGAHFLDSGDAYGRHWQRNQGKTWEDFTKIPVRLEASVYKHGDKPELELLGYISLAAWLEASVEYDPELQAQYDQWCEENDPDNDMYDMQRMEEFAESVHTGRKGDLHVQYTYNYDNDLSQDIQFIEFCLDGPYHSNDAVLVQVHGGCDARGGLTSPKAYKLKCEYFGRWSVDGYGCGLHQWDEDFSNSNDSSMPSLKDYPVHEFEYDSKIAHDLECLKQTNKNDEETRALMTKNAEAMEKEAFYDFCGSLGEPSIVVYNRKAYYTDERDGPEEIYGECWGLYN